LVTGAQHEARRGGTGLQAGGPAKLVEMRRNLQPDDLPARVSGQLVLNSQPQKEPS
jgi:hypothetical protein